jgi:hypothetical protein
MMIWGVGAVAGKACQGVLTFLDDKHCDRKREVQENRHVLFPVSLVPFEAIRAWKSFDAETGKDSAREIREYFIPDFSNWKNHDAYQPAFDRLLHDLKAEAPPAAGTAP